jgi:Predicted acyltransferases
MGFAILWIMLFHLRVPTDLAVIDFIRSVGYGGVDIFLFLSGFGLYFSMSRKNFEIKKYYRSRFFRIIPEYWVVIGFVFLAQMDFSARAFYLLICKATTLGYWIGYRDESWFISCILFLYAIYPIYFKLFKKYGLKASLHFIGAGFSLMLIYALTCIFFYDSKNYGGFIILTYARIPIFFIGAIFGHWAKDGCNIKLTKRLKVIGLSAAIIASVALVFFQTFLFYALQTCSLAYLPYIIITPVLCMLLAIFFDKYKTVDKIFTVFGLMSLELYLCHIFIYKLFFDFIDFLDKDSSNILTMLISFFAAYALYIVNKKVLTRRTNIRIRP